ncbi:MAG: PaaI family thioesterase [candidate division NC10 bacterium]|nr:PaaI family thioesterase [candidate division NC10 bacterium]
MGDGAIQTELVPLKRFQGFKDIVHGGIIATVLDEIMVNVAYLQGTLAVTSKLEIRLRKPAKVGERLVFQAKVQKESSKLLTVTSEARQEDGVLIAQGKALLMKVGEREAG